MATFEAFTDKGGRYITTSTVTLTMNHHGQLNIPKSVHEDVFAGLGYARYHADHDNELLAIEAFDEENAPAHAYKFSGADSKSLSVETVLGWLDKQPPEGHTTFELLEDEDTGFPYIDVSKLPDLDDGDE